ncbi:MAG: IspD/TarI family cytidylyltransferase [Sphaerochaetaceae bacterium]|nr:IspD/TarI family cytidylyltransferase [Sphaerochaetaceae bacterium]
MNIPSFALIITAAGTSNRFKSEVNGNTKKELMAIEGHSVLYLSIKPFFEVPNLKKVVIATLPDFMVQTEYALEDLHLQKKIPITIVAGGSTRQNSVFNALKEIKDEEVDFVMIHDGSRPFIKLETILTPFGTATITGASAPCIELSDSIKEVDENDLIINHVNRNNLRAIQTPQIFKFNSIFEAHKKAQLDHQTNFNDDTEIYEKYCGKRVILCKGDHGNKKITWAEDLK